MNMLTIVLIPAWIESALTKANKGLIDIFDRSTLPSILSNNDLIFYSRYQDVVVRKLAPELDAWSYFGTSMFFAEDYEKDPRFMKNYRDQDWITDPSIADMLGPIEGVSQDQANSPESYTYDLVEIKPDVYGLRVRAVETDYIPHQSERERIYRAIQLLDKVYRFEDLAGTNLFVAYTNAIKKQQPHF